MPRQLLINVFSESRTRGTIPAIDTRRVQASNGIPLTKIIIESEDQPLPTSSKTFTKLKLFGDVKV